MSVPKNYIRVALCVQIATVVRAGRSERKPSGRKRRSWFGCQAESGIVVGVQEKLAFGVQEKFVLMCWELVLGQPVAPLIDIKNEEQKG